MSAEVEMFLERLDRVKANGSHGWTARCPSHEDKSSSLSVTEGAGGKVLINCFAGCSALDVVQAVGLKLSDLFPKQLSDSMTHEERQQLHERSMRAKWLAALEVIDQETTIVVMAVNSIRRGRKVGEESAKRLNLAAQRLSDARTVLRTGPSKPRVPWPKREQQT